MPKNPATLSLLGLDEQHLIRFTDIDYLGQGAYSCTINVKSNGFSCEKVFGFDNDEYFLAKLKEVLVNQAGAAELMDLQSDNNLKIHAFGADTLLITGFIQEEEPLAQSMEFAFTTNYVLVEKFISEFAYMVRSNT
jgi:hypothetical protein